MREKAGDQFKDVWLECAGNLTDFRPIGTRGKYEFTRVDLIRAFGPGQSFGASVCQKGLQRMKSEGAFTATIRAGTDRQLRLSRRHGPAEAREESATADSMKRCTLASGPATRR